MLDPLDGFFSISEISVGLCWMLVGVVRDKSRASGLLCPFSFSYFLSLRHRICVGQDESYEFAFPTVASRIERW